MAPDADDSRADLVRFRDDLRHLAQRLLAPHLWDRVDLSGVIQKTFLETLQTWDRFQRLSDAEKPPWLRTALANNLRDELARLKTQKCDMAREQSLETALDASSSRVEAWLASEESSPSQKASRNEQTARLHAALDHLSPDRRKVVELNLQGLKLDAIAQAMGKTKAAVAQLLHRGIQDLTRLLDHE
jgi:RNA polymerase sigma-70 factor (subfamily 1)